VGWRAKYGEAIFGVGLFCGVSVANTTKQTWKTDYNKNP